MFSRRTQLGLAALAAFQFALLFGLAWARFTNVHNRTFDLALYARAAWGLAHGDAWQPVIDCHVLGSHVSPVLLPLGLLGRLFGTVPVLLAVQAMCVAACVWPLARIAARRLGSQGVVIAGAAWLLYPNLGHVATYEFHPGTLAVLPMCWGCDALDRGKLGALAWACAGVLVCREDFGAFCVLAACVLWSRRGDRRALWLAGATLAYTVVGVAATVHYAPAVNSSASQHFGIWGGSPLGVFRVLFTDPGRVLAHFGAPERLLYLLRVLAPLSLFSLRAPWMLLPGLPFLALNLLSEFPTAHQQFSHYLTPAVPALVASGLVGVARVQARNVRMLWFVTLAIGHHALGGLPLSRDFDRASFMPDPTTLAARAVLGVIPPGASVQAPDPLLPHLAERQVVRRGPPPEAGTDHVVLDVSHRQRFARRDDLLRTTEEPGVRRWLARPDYGLLVYAPPYALLRRGLDPRRAPAVQTYFVDARPNIPPRLLTPCLELIGAAQGGDNLALDFRAHGPCPADLALYLGAQATPSQADLLFDGALSPAQLRAGDVVRSQHVLRPQEAEAMRRQGVWVGLLRASGARPEPSDPAAVHVPL